jgi:hypothetical protein
VLFKFVKEGERQKREKQESDKDKMYTSVFLLLLSIYSASTMLDIAPNLVWDPCKISIPQEKRFIRINDLYRPPSCVDYVTEERLVVCVWFFFFIVKQNADNSIIRSLWVCAVANISTTAVRFFLFCFFENENRYLPRSLQSS